MRNLSGSKFSGKTTLSFPLCYILNQLSDLKCTSSSWPCQYFEPLEWPKSRVIMQRIHHNELKKLLGLPLSKKVDQQFVERWAASFWANTTRPKRNEDGEKFIMMFPPPNITGNMHLGHALTAAVQDALIRQRQMTGKRAVWIPGFDHAGLATQSIVDKQLRLNEGVTRQQLGRENFTKRVHQWKETKLAEMKAQIDRLGLALDRDKEYFTMDENSSYAVQTAFKQLFAKGIIYRAVRSVFWSNELQTTLSDIEVERVDGVERYFRSGEVVEKRPLNQWFIDAKEMALWAVKVVEDNSIEMIPPNYKRSWSSWLTQNGVHDWCISRQSWWGHRIPTYKLEASEDAQENWVTADSLAEAEQLLGGKGKVVQDTDVLDTWFSSSLLPLTISGWPNQEFSKGFESDLFPLDVMETGFDILNYWVSKMVMMSLTLTGKVPFKLILLHGMICDSEGKKMSKTKGNVIDPIDVIDGASLETLQKRTKDLAAQGIVEENQMNSVLAIQKKLFPRGILACGADGLRAYLLSHDIQEEVVRVQVVQIEKVRRLSNKIWNIFRFTISIIESVKDLKFKMDAICDIGEDEKTESSKIDQQVLEELSKCIHIADKSFNETYQLHHCFSSLELFWNLHLSAKFIEGSKYILLSQEDTDSKERMAKLRILIKCLVTSTKLLHPFMPHLTEFLYQRLNIALSNDNSMNSRLRMLSFETYPSPTDHCYNNKL